jgi:Ras family protein T1
MQIAEAALSPNTASPRTEPEPVDRTNMYIAAGVASKLILPLLPIA